MFLFFDPESKRQRENRKLLKTTLHDIETEIHRLDAEIRECRSTLGGYEKFIVESVMFVTDRNNLTTSKILGIHSSRMEDISHNLAILSASSVYLTQLSALSSSCADMTKMLDDKTKRVSGVLTSNSEAMLALIPEFIQNINRKLTAIYEQKRFLEEKYETVSRTLDTYHPKQTGRVIK